MYTLLTEKPVRPFIAFMCDNISHEIDLGTEWQYNGRDTIEKVYEQDDLELDLIFTVNAEYNDNLGFKVEVSDIELNCIDGLVKLTENEINYIGEKLEKKITY